MRTLEPFEIKAIDYSFKLMLESKAHWIPCKPIAFFQKDDPEFKSKTWVRLRDILEEEELIQYPKGGGEIRRDMMRLTLKGEEVAKKGFQEFYEVQLNAAIDRAKIKDIEKQKLIDDATLSAFQVKDYPRTKWIAYISLALGIIAVTLEIIRLFNGEE